MVNFVSTSISNKNLTFCLVFSLTLKNNIRLLFPQFPFQRFILNKFIVSSLFYYFYRIARNNYSDTMLRFYNNYLYTCMNKNFSYWYNNNMGRQKYNPFSLKRVEHDLNLNKYFYVYLWYCLLFVMVYL
jgi:hypothetical protein